MMRTSQWPFFRTPDPLSWALAQAFIPRPIRHPLFKNLSAPDVIHALSTAGEDGDCMFRPSQKVRMCCPSPAVSAVRRFCSRTAGPPCFLQPRLMQLCGYASLLQDSAC